MLEYIFLKLQDLEKDTEFRFLIGLPTKLCKVSCTKIAPASLVLAAYCTTTSFNCEGWLCVARYGACNNIIKGLLKKVSIYVQGELCLIKIQIIIYQFLARLLRLTKMNLKIDISTKRQIFFGLWPKSKNWWSCGARNSSDCT